MRTFGFLVVQKGSFWTPLLLLLLSLKPLSRGPLDDALKDNYS